MQISDIIATIGVTILLIAFFLQIIKVIKTESIMYSLLNFTGAATAGYASFLISFFPFVILETVWSIVALYSLILIVYKNKVPRET